MSTAVWVDVFAPQEVDETPEKKGLPVLGADGKMRPPWAERSKAMRSYYDEHWGNPQLTERELFATLSLLILQAGLFWGASLARREQLSAGLAGFDPDVLASFEAEDVEACLRNENLIRNKERLKHMVHAVFPEAKVEVGSCGALCSYYAEYGGLMVGYEDNEAPTV